MSNNGGTVIPAYQKAVQQAQSHFEKIEGNRLDFARESGFAIQAISASQMLQRCDMQSIRRSVTNVAMVGISLNPALAQAYLVPRGNMCCLDISYRGLIKIATDSGSVSRVEAHIVYKNDHFEVEYGTHAKVIHRPIPFGDRGEMVGVYCLATLPDGGLQVETMSKEQINEVRNRSKAKSGPWVTDYEEMARKTVVKRAYKYWPKTDKLAEAMKVLNEHEGLVSEAREDTQRQATGANEALRKMHESEAMDAEIVEQSDASAVSVEFLMSKIDDASSNDDLEDIRGMLTGSGLDLKEQEKIAKAIGKKAQSLSEEV